MTPFHTLRITTPPPRIYRCEPGWRWSPPPLTDYDLWCVLDGIGEMRIGGRLYPLRADVCFIVPPGVEPRAEQDRERRLTVFAVHFEVADSAGKSIPPADWNPPLGHALRDRALLDALTIRSEAAWLRGDDSGRRLAHLMVEQLVLQICAEAEAREASPVETTLREIARAIRAEPGGDWNVARQAQRAYLSPSQYTRRFTAAFGVPPAQFVARTRLERATQLIRETDMSVTQIASALGYRDVFFFSRQFKARYGYPPSDLRR